MRWGSVLPLPLLFFSIVAPAYAIPCIDQCTKEELQHTAEKVAIEHSITWWTSFLLIILVASAVIGGIGMLTDFRRNTSNKRSARSKLWRKIFLASLVSIGVIVGLLLATNPLVSYFVPDLFWTLLIS